MDLDLETCDGFGTRWNKARYLMIDHALKLYGGNKEKAARYLGISIRTIRNYVNRDWKELNAIHQLPATVEMIESAKRYLLHPSQEYRYLTMDDIHKNRLTRAKHTVTYKLASESERLEILARIKERYEATGEA